MSNARIVSLCRSAFTKVTEPSESTTVADDGKQGFSDSGGEGGAGNEGAGGDRKDNVLVKQEVPIRAVSETRTGTESV